MIGYISLALSCLLVSNIVLTQFLGICPFLGVSTNKKSAFSMGVAVTCISVVSAIITYLLYKFVLLPLNIGYMQTIVDILVIASLVQFLELIIKRFLPKLYESFGVYLPLITTNCLVLGVCLNLVIYNYNFLQVLVYSLFTSLGYLLVLVIFSGIRTQLSFTKTPKAFKGVPIALIVAALMAMAFSAFAGII